MAHSPLCRSDQWGAIFRSEDIDVAANNANAPAAVASSEARAAEAGPTPTASDGLGGEAVAADVMGATLLADADAVDVAHALEHDADAVGGSHVAEPAAADPTPCTAYANGDPTAALGGRGVSTPPDQCLAAARQRSESALTAGAASGPAVAVDAGVER